MAQSHSYCNPMIGRATGWEFEYSGSMSRSLGFVQRTGRLVAWRHVCENAYDAAVAIEPHKIERESHVCHPDRMPALIIPFQQQALDLAKTGAIRESCGSRSGRVGDFHDDRPTWRFKLHRGQLTSVGGGPDRRRQQRQRDGRADHSAAKRWAILPLHPLHHESIDSMSNRLGGGAPSGAPPPIDHDCVTAAASYSA